MHHHALRCALGLFVTAGVLSAAASGPALATKGRVPIFEATTISESGSYVVTRRIEGPGPLIEVLANDVELDLNGFSLAPESGAGIFVDGAKRVRIGNGFVVGGDVGVRLRGVGGAKVDRVTLSGQAAEGVRAVDTRALSLRDLIVRGSGAAGISVDGSALAIPPSVEVVGNQVLAATGDGLELISIGTSFVRDNVLAECGGRGVTLSSSFGVTLDSNVVFEAGLAGIALLGSSGQQLFGNVVRSAGSDGVVIDSASHDNTLRGNQVTASVTKGLQIGGDRNVVELNLLNANGDYGLNFNANAADNVFRTNMARGNGGAGCPGSTADFCDAGTNNSTAGDNFMPGLF